MASGRSKRIVGQTGEYLVPVELGPRKLIATAFTGNTPHYDIIASDKKRRHLSMQAQAARESSWRFGDIRHYCEITVEWQRQIAERTRECPARLLGFDLLRVALPYHASF